jgi:hypothetical protein
MPLALPMAANESTAKSMSSSLCAAEIWQRMRACGGGKVLVVVLVELDREACACNVQQ